MASIFAHAIAASSLVNPFNTGKRKFKILGLASLCAIIPDADVIMFRFGIPYGHMLGHRGFTHSILFAILLSIIITKLFFYKTELFSKKGILLMFLFFMATISHGLLDAMTTGGLGTGFFIPVDESRYFFPLRPIKVSPIGIENFFSEWGLSVLKSEFIWVFLPCLGFNFVVYMIKQVFHK